MGALQVPDATRPLARPAFPSENLHCAPAEGARRDPARRSFWGVVAGRVPTCASPADPQAAVVMAGGNAAAHVQRRAVFAALLLVLTLACSQPVASDAADTVVLFDGSTFNAELAEVRRLRRQKRQRLTVACAGGGGIQRDAVRKGRDT